MQHPTYEQLLSHFEGSAPPAEDKELREHLHKCSQCASELAGWRRTVQKLQDAHLPEPETLPITPGAVLKWAAAAAIVILATGFVLGRVSAPSVSAIKKTVAAEVRQQVREELKQEMIASLGTSAPGGSDGFRREFRQAFERFLSSDPHRGLALQATERRQAENQRALLALLTQIRQVHEADYLSLRRDLETVAVVADRNLRHDQQQLSQLTATMFAKNQ